MPKFYPGLKTKYQGKIAYLVECINEHDIKDIRLQGKRWYILSAGHIWSVTENELRSF